MKLRTPRGPLDRLAALDPTGQVGRRLVGVARRVPGVATGERQLQRLEDAVLRELGRRLDEARGAPQLTSRVGSSEGLEHSDPSEQNGDGEEVGQTPAERMQSLLQRSIEQTPDEGERSLVEMLVRELVPDEARILAALADGSVYVLIDIVARGGSDRGRRILANASGVGRAAGVVLPERVPTYVTHLLSLDLVVRGPQDDSLHDQYEILLTDPALIRARRQSTAGLRSPRVVRATLRISDLGQTVWSQTWSA